tara:strand:+ start:4079 stop:4201 length:123 start_codon:yes stop_codon:yes gene_type:complete
MQQLNEREEEEEEEELDFLSDCYMLLCNLSGYLCNCKFIL